MSNENNHTHEQQDLNPGHSSDHGNHHLVDVVVDGKDHEVEKGRWIVSDFKAVVRVPADYVLDQVVDGILVPLEDGQEIHIKGGEVYISHVRQGGSPGDSI